MKRPPSCACGCGCNVTFTPADGVLREQWLYGASLKLDNNPIQESLTAPFAIQIDGLPDGPKTLPGGPRAFGPSAPGAPSTGWGYFNVNPNSVRFQTFCDWPDMHLTSFDPLSLIMRADHPYPDEDLHDNPRRPHVPFRFFGNARDTCQVTSGYEHVVHKADILIGEIPTETQIIDVTFNDMYFSPTGFYFDRVQIFKYRIPIGRASDGNLRTPPDPVFAPLIAYQNQIDVVFFNHHMGTEAVPIVNVPKSECVFNPRPPLIVNYNTYSDTIWPVEHMTDLSYLDAWATVNVRDNLLPGYKITVPKISGDPHVGRTVEDSIDIYTRQTFDTGHWIVTPTIELLKCDAQLCHYYHIPYSSSSGYTNSVVLSPPDNGRIGNEAILPLSGGPVVGWVRRRDSYNTYFYYTTTDPTTGVFIQLAYPFCKTYIADFVGNQGLMPFCLLSSPDTPDTMYYSRLMGVGDPDMLPLAYVQAFMDSFNSGDIFEIEPSVGIPERLLPGWNVATTYLPSTHGRGKYQLPAFLGEQDVTYTYEPQSGRLEDRSRDITSLYARKPNSQIPADGYEHVMTEAERALYRLPADPVTIPLEPREIVHANDTYVGSATAVVDGLAVCFSTSWGGFNPNYIYPPNDDGPFKTETHSVGTATMVREQYT